jgi:hypothetical protein
MTSDGQRIVVVEVFRTGLRLVERRAVIRASGERRLSSHAGPA